MDAHDFIAAGEAELYRGRLIPIIRGGSGMEPEAAPETQPAADPVAAPTAVEPPAPAPLTRDEIISAAREAAREGGGEAFANALAQAAEEQRQAAARAAAEHGAQLPEWDPYDPEVVLAYTRAAMAPTLAQLQSQIATTAEVTNDYSRQQGELEAATLLNGLKAEGGTLAGSEFSNADVIARARYELTVNPGLDPATVLRDAAQAEHDRLTAMETRLRERFGVVAQAHIAAGNEPGTGGAAGEVATLPRGKAGYTEQLKRSMASRGMTAGVGTPGG